MFAIPKPYQTSTALIYLTTSANDKDLPKHFKGIGLTAPIPYGDFVFRGKWTGNEDVLVCGDRKKVPDLVQCIRDHRHMEQVRDAHAAGYGFIFLVIEGQWRERSDGLLEYRRGSKWTCADIEISTVLHYIFELIFYLGVVTLYTKSARETARNVITLYHMFQKPPEEHHLLEGIHNPKLPRQDLFTQHSLLQRIAHELPGIGVERSKAVDKEFGTVLDMVNSPLNRWLGIDGIGKITAGRVYHAIRKKET